jgi:hypothetical protein
LPALQGEVDSPVRAVRDGLKALLSDLETRAPAVRPVEESEGPPALRELDRRIVESNPSDALRYLYVREGIVRQNEYMRDREHLRRMESRELIMRGSAGVPPVNR